MGSCCEWNRYRIAVAAIATSAVGGLPAVATDVLWDNGDTDGSGGRSNAVEEVFGARRTLLDDFVVPEGETWRLEAFEHRHIWFNGEPPGSGTGMEIMLWSDDDGEPGSPRLELLITNYTEESTGRIMFDRAEAVSFTVPIATDGDCFCRYLVRLEEMRQSAGIIDQLIDRLPEGPLNAGTDGKHVIPAKGDVYGSIEGAIQQFEIFMTNRGWDTPIGESYGAIEGPNGELGFYIVADGTKNPWRAATRPPSLIHFQVLARMLEGHNLADLVAVLGSLNIIAAELDR